MATTDYAKKTVADLQEILKSRSLPHSGKKAELVARLTEDDKSKIDQVAAEAPAAAAAAPAAQSQIAEPIPTQQPTLAKPIDPVDAPAAPAPPAPSTNPSAPTNSVPDSSSAAATTASAAPAPPTYTANLTSSTLESELEKRRARAARFGLQTESESGTSNSVTDAEKALQRAQRFGAVDNTNGAANGSNGGVGGLDRALPERERRGRGGHRGGGHRRGGRGNTPGRVGDKGEVKKTQTFASEKDRLAAEARLKRFAT